MRPNHSQTYQERQLLKLLPKKTRTATRMESYEVTA